MLQAQGKLEAAKEAFGENLAISRRLAEHDLSNAEWQRDLALGPSGESHTSWPRRADMMPRCRSTRKRVASSKRPNSSENVAP